MPSSRMVDVGWNALFKVSADSEYLDEDVRKIVERDSSQLLSVIGFVHGTSATAACKALHITEV